LSLLTGSCLSADEFRSGTRYCSIDPTYVLDKVRCHQHSRNTLADGGKAIRAIVLVLLALAVALVGIVGCGAKQKGGGEKEHGSHGQQAEHEQHPIEKACREESKHLRVFNCEPMGMEGVVYNVQMQPERDRQTYEHALAHIDRVVPDELAIHVYFYSGEGDYRKKIQNAVATVTAAGDYSVGQYGGTAPPLYGKLERKDK
jgi:hypothetical protein